MSGALITGDFSDGVFLSHDKLLVSILRCVVLKTRIPPGDARDVSQRVDSLHEDVLTDTGLLAEETECRFT